MQQSPEEETPFVYVTLATLVTMATGGYTPCLFGYVTIGLARHNRTHFSQSERLLVKLKRPCTDLCAEPVGVWNRLVKIQKRCQKWNLQAKIRRKSGITQLSILICFEVTFPIWPPAAILDFGFSQIPPPFSRESWRLIFF